MPSHSKVCTMRRGGVTSRKRPSKPCLAPSGVCSTNRQWPPRRGSSRSIVSLLPRPHHCATSAGSVIAAHTRSRGAAKMRSIRIVRSFGVVTVAFALAIMAAPSSAWARWRAGFARETHRGDRGALRACGGTSRSTRLLGEPAGTEPAGPHATLLLAGHQPRVLEDADVLLDPGQRHGEVPRELADRRAAAP